MQMTFCRNAGYLPELAWTCYDYANALQQHDSTGENETVKTLLDESLAISGDLAMQPLMERAISLQR